MEFRTVASGLLFPEGPIALDDGVDMRDAYLVLSGTGSLIKVVWPRPGLRLNFAR